MFFRPLSCLSVCLSVCVCLTVCLLVCVPACVPACLPACLPASLLFVLPPLFLTFLLSLKLSRARSTTDEKKQPIYLVPIVAGTKKKTNKKQNKTKQQQQQQRAPPLKASCGQASPRHDKAHARGGLVPVPAGHSAVTSCVHARELRVRGGGGDVGHEAALFPAQSGGVRLLGGNIHREFLFCFVLFVCTPFASWPTYSSTTPFGNIRTDYTLI